MLRLVSGISEREYHADPCDVPSLSASIAHLLVSRSPAHAWAAHPKLGGQSIARPESTVDQKRGTLLHALLLGTAADHYEVVPATSYRTKAAKARRDEIVRAGKEPILAEPFARAGDVALQIAANLLAYGIDLSTGLREHVAFWREVSAAGVVQCRGRLDHYDEGPELEWAQITDVKTCRSAKPEALRRHVEHFGYDIQAAAYRRAIEAMLPELAGRVRFRFVFVEADPPHVCTPIELDGQSAAIGETKWLRAVELWGRCLTSGVWPAYVPAGPGAHHRLEPSPGALAREIEAEIEAEEAEQTESTT